MKKKIWIPIIAVTLLTGIFFLIYPKIEIQTYDKFIVFRYSDDFSILNLRFLIMKVILIMRNVIFL